MQLENYHVPDLKTHEMSKDIQTVLTFWGEKNGEEDNQSKQTRKASEQGIISLCFGVSE